MSIKLSTLKSSANSVAFPGAGLCLKWVQDVYEKSGVRAERLATAKLATQKWLHQKGVENIKAGMAIGFLGNSSTHKAGHIGIYLGDNKVINSENSGLSTVSLNSFCSAYMSRNYGSPYCGWFGEVEVVDDSGSSGGFNLSNLKVLSKGSMGTQVKVLQSCLYKIYGFDIAVDGSFGSATHSAVCNFQKKYGLNVDGYCGPKTWVKLLGA